MKKNIDFYTINKGFIIQSLIFATISTLTIEIRRSIYSTKQNRSKYPNFVIDLFYHFIFILRTLPYQISKNLNLLNKFGEVPEFIKIIYTFSLSFTISIIVYNFFLLTIGSKNINKYFFGWTTPLDS